MALMASRRSCRCACNHIIKTTATRTSDLKLAAHNCEAAVVGAAAACEDDTFVRAIVIAAVVVEALREAAVQEAVFFAGARHLLPCVELVFTGALWAPPWGAGSITLEARTSA